MAKQDPIPASDGDSPTEPAADAALLRLSEWNNGTVVEETVLKARQPTSLAVVGSTQATLVIVCLDECRWVHLGSDVRSPRREAVAAGSILLFDLQEEHRLLADCDVRIVCFGIELKLLDELVRRAPITGTGATSIEDRDQVFADAAVHGLATSARAVLHNPSPSSGLFLEQVTCAVAAHLLVRMDASRARLSGSGGLAPWQLAKVKRMVNANLGRPIQAHELAEACGLSPSHFSRAFRSSTGDSPHAWVTARRVARAKELMRTSDTPLAEIALECGFADQSHFTRVFTREAGVSPGLWRRSLSPDERRPPGRSCPPAHRCIGRQPLSAAA